MPRKKQKKKSRQSKSLYIYMALVTMAVVHFFAKPFKRGLGILNHRLRQASQEKNSLRAQLSLNQNQQPLAPIDAAPVVMKQRKNRASK